MPVGTNWLLFHRGKQVMIADAFGTQPEDEAGKALLLVHPDRHLPPPSPSAAETLACAS
jgi:hypothetical protein